MISAFCRGGCFEEAKQLAGDFEAKYDKYDVVLLMVDMHRKGHQPEEDNSDSISHPDIKKFASAFVRLGNINLVNDVMKAIHATGYRIDQGIFHIAIARYIAEREKKELLLKLLEWMTGQGYVVDSSTRNLILKNSHLFGRQLIADILSKQHMKSKSSRTLKE
ncbi:pentatricopeptide repeat-containing protein [Citrus sinensis]|uniref:Pentatricopeptide repeat-containing protein n=1 Tax=Citrus sinensis TaxID=2711 RepID=A0ACB8KB89_CITSI|nr:pentatricopeptide repeat-containing protein [Citrus sinensis]